MQIKNKFFFPIIAVNKNLTIFEVRKLYFSKKRDIYNIHIYNRVFLISQIDRRGKYWFEYDQGGHISGILESQGMSGNNFFFLEFIFFL